MQVVQTIPTNATVSKDSDKISISVIMAVYEIIVFYIFQANLRNQEIVYQHNITEKYYKIGRSKLLNIGYVSNETNTDVRMYIEEFILAEIWIHYCTKLK